MKPSRIKGSRTVTMDYEVMDAVMTHALKHGQSFNQALQDLVESGLRDQTQEEKP